MLQNTWEVGLRFQALFYAPCQTVEPLEAFNLFGPIQLGSLKRTPQNTQGLIISLERNGEWVAVLTA